MILLLVGAVLIVAVSQLSRDPVALLAAYDVWKRERAEERQQRQHRTEAIRYYKDLIASSPDGAERSIAAFEIRILKHSEGEEPLSTMIDYGDGIDEFEAFLIARVYFVTMIGACGSVGLPELIGTTWVVPISIGRKVSRDAPLDAPILIDAKTGSTSCVGYPQMAEPRGSFRDFKATQIRPNKSLQPTATAVTPPAAQEIVPAVAVAEH
jgi:hypothetical protein